MATSEGDHGWGIAPGYHDVWGSWKTPTPKAALGLRRAMGAQTDDPTEQAPASTPLHVLAHGSSVRLSTSGAATLRLEDGTAVPVNDGLLPPDLPLGYHRLETTTGGAEPNAMHLVVVPARAHLPNGLHGWGITAQLYAARSRDSWGIGDFGGLGHLAAWARERGASTIGLNPLHANAPGGPPANSPYSPSSRRFLDPIYLDVPALMTAHGLAASSIDEVTNAGRRLNTGALIDRDASWRLKVTALEQIWAQRPLRFEPRVETAPTPTHPSAAELLTGAKTSQPIGVGSTLWLWGTFCAIAEQHGQSWTRWPTDLQHPESTAVQRFATNHRERVGFWVWLQALAEAQLAATGASDWLITDLAVGFAPDGFDAWQWQDQLALGTHVGAPPDLLGPDGQDWGLPPFVPHQVRSTAYAPIAETLRANLRHGAGIRIDHVMGLLRLFWIPPGLDASEGAYVTWPGTELLDVVALESQRANAFVIGEDLGTVDEAIRQSLASRAILSTRLLWFEDEAPRQWPSQAMAAITTHDLPTIAGVWSGVDLADQHVAGVTVPADGDELFRHRLRVAALCDDEASVDDVAVSAHRALADAPSMLVTAALDDLMGAQRRPNIPGTIDEHPNWRIPLPMVVEDLPATPLAQRITDTLRNRR